MTKVTIRPAISSDLKAFTADALDFRIRAITLVIDGNVQAIGGLGFPERGPVVAFMDQCTDLRKYPVAIHRAGIAGMKLIRDSGLNEIVATVDPANRRALRWIKHFGFVEAVDQPVPNKVLFYWIREHAT